MAGKNNTTFISALRKKYKDEVIADMMARFKYSNIMEVPHITQISSNMGIHFIGYDRWELE